MTFSSIVRSLVRSPLTTELNNQLKKHQQLGLNGISRLPKNLIASALASQESRDLCIICATLEEAGRFYAQLEAMGWNTVHFYPTSEASPYQPFDPETELSWGQMQVLADLVSNSDHKSMAIITTIGALQPHLPPRETFKSFCLTLQKDMGYSLEQFGEKITALGYERVSLVETEGQWSRRGDIVDVFPVACELPVRLEWFGDDIEKIREFDPSTQRSALDKINQITLTPTSFAPIVLSALKDNALFWQFSSQLDLNSEVIENSGLEG
ncbi:MAG: transcription-repair coupling factor, partial [Cylindrospermopsis raciborskii]